jgi:hypothetical protein
MRRFLALSVFVAVGSLAVSPPQVTSLNGTFSSPTSTSPQTTSVTVTFPTPMVVTANGLAGLRTEFDIRQSLAVDGTGQITGLITPVMLIQAVKAINPEGQITDLIGTISSVNVSANAFVLQGPFGHQFTINVDGSTDYNQGFTLATLPTTGGFVALQGTMQLDGTIVASDVEFITTDQAFVSGRILAINPASGPVQTVTLWVGEFGNASMLVGQRIFIGGTFSGSAFTPDFISLRRQGVSGLVVPGSVTVTSANAGNFQLQNTGLLGLSLGGPLTVNTGAGTLLFQGNSNTLTLTDLQTASAVSSVPVVARGWCLRTRPPAIPCCGLTEFAKCSSWVPQNV